VNVNYEKKRRYVLLTYIPCRELNKTWANEAIGFGDLFCFSRLDSIFFLKKSTSIYMKLERDQKN